VGGAPSRARNQFLLTPTVVDRLETAGAVLIAKLSMVALAMGDCCLEADQTPWDNRTTSVEFIRPDRHLQHRPAGLVGLLLDRNLGIRSSTTSPDRQLPDFAHLRTR